MCINVKRITFLIFLVVFGPMTIIFSQTLTPDPSDTSMWYINRPDYTSIEDGVVTLDSEGDENGAMMVLSNIDFKEGTIELDIKGADKQGQNFVGLAFNIRGENLYEAVYFRPFNFKNPDRKSHASQYIYMPANSWRLLRTEFPGRYENEISPPPDPNDWFHVRMVFQGDIVKVYVEDETEPTLVVERIALVKNGAIGFWVGYNTKGAFKNLEITPTSLPSYGYNDEVGEYFEVAPDTKLYYEVYGEGAPILMLHGGVYGYIDEYEYFITELSKTNQVICLGTRGHVKSDIGHEPNTFHQRAGDAAKMLDHLGVDKADVIGFSDGGLSAFKLAALYPDKVNKMVVIGAGDRLNKDGGNSNYNAKDLMANSKEYFENRVAAMPEPDRWDESLQMLNQLYNGNDVRTSTFELIKSPVLLLSGDQDEFGSPASLMSAHKSIPQSSLAIIPGCGHVVFYCNWDAVWASVQPFLSR